MKENYVIFQYTFPGGSVGKEPASNAEDAGDSSLIPGQKDQLEEGTTAHSSILAWRIGETKEPGGLPSTGSQRVGHS